MFERFTDRARKVMALANQECQRFNHEQIGTEHILLGLIKEGAGVGSRVLKSLGIDLRDVRAEIEKLVTAKPDIVTMGKLPQTAQAKKAVQMAIDEAQAHNAGYVGTEHLLLGLLRHGESDPEDVAGKVLRNLGLKLEDVREEVLNLLGESDPNKSLEVQMTLEYKLKRARLLVEHKFPSLLNIAANQIFSRLLEVCLMASITINLDGRAVISATALRDLIDLALKDSELAKLDQ